MNVLPLIFLLLWAGFLFGGYFLGDADPYQRIPRWCRMNASLALVGGAWSLVGLQLWPGTTQPLVLLALGMVFGLVGDLFLAELMPGPKPNVLAGMGAFATGHVLYISASLAFARELGLGSENTFPWGWGIMGIVGGICWYVVVFRPAATPGLLHYVALPYALLLSMTVGSGLGLTLQQWRFFPFLIGAALFLFSDLLIAYELFNERRLPRHNDIVWLTYSPGQALIVFTPALLWLL